MEEGEFREVLEPFFVFALIWSVGATTDSYGREKFNFWIRDQMSTKPLANPIPSNRTVYDYIFLLPTKEWTSWLDYQAMCDNLSDAPPSNSSIIHTMDTIRNTFLIDLLLMNGHQILCTGATGTGKSVTIQQKLINALDQKFTPISINFSARTNANQTQDLVDSKMEKRRKGVFGPPAGKKFVLFIDDLNMPQLDLCNSQPPVELFRQWMDWHGWYDRKAIGKFMEIVDISFICAMGHPGGGRNPITARFSRHFNLFNYIEMDHPSLQKIFTTILGKFFMKFPEDIANLSGSIVDASISIYDTIRIELLPTPNKSHYTFNLRDLSKVVQGILSADIKSVITSNDMVRLWSHECMRVFQDRLVDKTDKDWFKNLLQKSMEKELEVTWGEVVTSEPLFYGDYMNPGTEAKLYVQIKVLIVNLGFEKTGKID
jgi:dynein heavy chain